MNLTIRPMLPREAVLVHDSWTRSTVAMSQPVGAKATGRFCCRVGMEGTNERIIGWAFFEMHRAWVKDVMQRPNTVVLVATLPGHDEAMGYVVLTQPGDHPLVVHYAFTVQPARRKGVARALVRAALQCRDSRPPRFTHTSQLGEYIVDTIEHRRAAPMRSEAVMP